MSLQAVAGEPQPQSAGQQATDIRGDIVGGIEIQHARFVVTATLLQELRQPRPNQLPDAVDANDHDHQRPEAAVARQTHPPVTSTRRGVAGGSTADFQVAAPNERQPRDDPQRPARTDDEKRQAPNSGGGVAADDRTDHQGREDSAQRRPALQNAVAHQAIVGRKGGLCRAERTGPVAGLEEAEDRAARQERAVAARQARGDAHRRPSEQDNRIEDADVDAIGEDAEGQGADGEPPAEDEFDIAVLLLGEPEFIGDPHGEVRQRLPVHVIDHRGQQQQATDPPFPGGGRGGRCRCYGHAEPPDRLSEECGERENAITSTPCMVRPEFRLL